jgi:hypothetical protein
MDLRERVWGGMNWIDVTKNWDVWRAFVITAINFRI